MWLLTGLGNPGSQYESTRHNVGFEVVDSVARREGATQWSDKEKYQMCRLTLGNNKVVVLKPTTYMNLSGEAVASALRYFKIEISRLIVVHDELDLALGTVRLKQGGGEAGHNGLKSISRVIGTKDYIRVRVGIGKPTNPKMDIASWVLSRFQSEEVGVVQEMCFRAGEAVTHIISDGFTKAQADLNIRRVG
jgi:PTH1 family peptidyl-tRNA hydrolase